MGVSDFILLESKVVGGYVCFRLVEDNGSGGGGLFGEKGGRKVGGSFVGGL